VAAQLRTLCALDDAGARALELAVRKMGLSARAHDRILKVARTLRRDALGRAQIGDGTWPRRCSTGAWIGTTGRKAPLRLGILARTFRLSPPSAPAQPRDNGAQATIMVRLFHRTIIKPGFTACPLGSSERVPFEQGATITFDLNPGLARRRDTVVFKWMAEEYSTDASLVHDLTEPVA
jgi:hypothetical protein